MFTRRTSYIRHLHPLTTAAAVSLIVVSLAGVAKLTGYMPDAAQATAKSSIVKQTAIGTSGAGADGDTASGTATRTVKQTELPITNHAVNNQIASAPPSSAAPFNDDAKGASGVAPKASASGNTPSVYVHVLDEAARQRMTQFEPVLKRNGISLAGIKIVSTAPARSDLRYFHPDEKTEALRVQAVLIALGLPAQRLKKIEGMEQMAKLRQYELWLSES